VNINKIIVKILQGSVVTQTVLAWCKFPIVCMCYKLWKLVGSIQLLQ